MAVLAECFAVAYSNGKMYMLTLSRRDQKHQPGFTIVELLIVIVVIAILAAISIVAYVGIQERARDSQRMSDLNAMRKSLEMYKVEHGSYPLDQPNPGYGTTRTWETSVDPGFLSSLDAYTGGARFAAPGEQEHLVNEYAYNYYSAGTYGCNAADGPYAILRVTGLETQSGSVLETGPCTGNTQGAIDGDYSVWLFE